MFVYFCFFMTFPCPEFSLIYRGIINFQIHILTCALIGMLCNTRSTMKVDLIRKSIVLALVTLLQEQAASQKSPSHRALVLELYVQVTSLLLYFSTGPQKICVDTLLFEGVIDNMVKLCNRSNAEMFGYSDEARWTLEQLIYGKVVKGVATDLDQQESEEAFLRHLGHGYQRMTCLRSGFQIELQEDNAVYDTMASNGYYLVDKDRDGSEAEGNDRTQNMELLVTLVIDGAHFWAWIGTESSQELAATIVQEISEAGDGRPLENVQVGGIGIVKTESMGELEL